MISIVENIDVEFDKLSIKSVYMSEQVLVTFLFKDVPWEKDYKLLVHNSISKHEIIEVYNKLIISNLEMVLIIEPLVQNINVGNHYYEIFDTINKRVQYSGTLEVKK